jgi:hypothetical protein
MASGQIVAIKIPPYLKEFFIYKHGAEPIKATRETKFFIFISQYLTRKPKGWKPPVTSDDTMLIELPHNEVLEVRTYCYISEKNMPEVKTYIYGLFFGAFISYMNEKVLNQEWAIKYAIINFCDEHNMSWTKTNYETLQKIYYRYRFPEGERTDKKKIEKFLRSGSRKKRLTVHYPSIFIQ